MGLHAKHVAAEPDKPYVEIKRMSRFTYVATLYDPGLSRFPESKYMSRVHREGFLTRRGAELGSARILRRYMRTLGYAAEGKTIITLEGTRG